MNEYPSVGRSLNAISAVCQRQLPDGGDLPHLSGMLHLLGMKSTIVQPPSQPGWPKTLNEVEF